ncbi:hypothetical protein [Ectobacillus panaciterrae]|nr:hypothetical protein [Ectobacillus panaciterrae]
MKKIATLLYLVLLIMTLIACGRETSKTPAEQGRRLRWKKGKCN